MSPYTCWTLTSFTMQPILTSLTPYLPVLVLALSLLSLVLIVLVIMLSVRLSRFMKGSDARSLEGLIRNIVQSHKDLRTDAARVDATLDDLHSRLSSAARGIATIRYNALTGDTSGRQSFATAILTEEGNGVVISSLHSRNATRVYAKPIARFVSEHDLSEEEIGAIAEARNRCA